MTPFDKELTEQDCSCRLPLDAEMPTSLECCARCMGLDEIPDGIPEITMLGRNEAAGKVR